MNLYNSEHSIRNIIRKIASVIRLDYQILLTLPPLTLRAALAFNSKLQIFISLLLALFMFPLAEISCGNPRLTKTIEINLVLIMSDYFKCAKTDGSSKSNKNLLTVLTDVTISFKWNEPRDVVVVKIASWITTEARIMAGADILLPAGCIPPADQYIQVRQTPCTSFPAPRFRLWTAV